MKKILFLLLFFSMSVRLLMAEETRSTIAVSIPPQSFFIEKIAPGMFQVEIMIPAGANPHTFEPSIIQLKAISKADLYFEIVDAAGNPVSEGQNGEIVFTTLTRQGMPLIRYRTGDFSSFIPDPCSCGSVIRRLDRITKRKNNHVSISANQHFDMSDLDENIFALPGVIDFAGSVDNLRKVTQLNIEVVTVDQSDQVIESLLSKALDAVELIGQTRRDGKMKVIVKTMRCDGNLSIGAGKRKIMESI